MFLSSTDLSYFHPQHLGNLRGNRIIIIIIIIIINRILNRKELNIYSVIITVVESMLELCSYLWPKGFIKLISKDAYLAMNIVKRPYFT
jgi:hypothetical protein